MQNSLIPYSFIPGTKAKAQEVNANFIALADKIQENQTTLKEQLTETEKTFSQKLEQVENSITNECADLSLVNTGTVTNTILEAPNGVVDYEGQTVNVKAGLKVLIPDGKKENGKLKNIVYVTENVISKTATNFKNSKTVLFLNDDGTTEFVNESHVLYKNTTPTTLVDNVHWYNTDTNKWNKYAASSSEWLEIKCIPIALQVWNADGQISSVSSSKPLSLVKTSDLSDFYTIRGILPKELDYVVERYQSNWNFYTVYKSGWVRQGGYIEGNGDTVANFYIPLNIGLHVTITRTSGASTTSGIPVWMRAFTTTYAKFYSSAHTGKVWCVEGYRTVREEV